MSGLRVGCLYRRGNLRIGTINRLDGDGDGQPGATLALSGVVSPAIALHAHFRQESTLIGAGVEDLRAGLNTWPPKTVVIL